MCRGGVYGGDGRDRVGGLAVRRGRRREHEEGYAEPESRSPLRGHTWEWGDAPEARLGPTGARSAEGAAREPGPGEGAALRPPPTERHGAGQTTRAEHRLRVDVGYPRSLL